MSEKAKKRLPEISQKLLHLLLKRKENYPLHKKLKAMKYSKTTNDLLQQYDIDIQNGFLPKLPPLNHLPVRYRPWEDLNTDMTNSIKAGNFVKKVEELPHLMVENLNKRELERAIMVLGALAHAYVKETGHHTIPAQLAVPWVAVAEQLERLPIIAHASLVLQNWRLKDNTKAFHLDNLCTQIDFTGTKTESWFFLATTYVEKVGAAAIPLILESIYFAKKEEYEKAVDLLKQALPILKETVAALTKMYEHCDPTIFYHQVRLYFDSFKNVKYTGTMPAIRSYSGGSAAQSSLLQFFDMSVGMEYGKSSSREFLLDMRRYMPAPHRAFLDFVEKEYNLKITRTNNEVLNQVCKEVVELLIEFRNEHLKIVSQYIVRPALQSQQSITGTGGTNPLIFLKAIRNKNREENE